MADDAKPPVDPWEHTSGFVSSNISEFRYDKSTDTLQVDFNSGDTYEYYNVPPTTHRAFQAAGSKGEFFARHIKGRYSYEQV
jgi:hypothetical protein